MAPVEATPTEGLRVIVCLEFAQRAPFDELAKFKKSLLASTEVVHCVEVSGSFDVMLEVACADLQGYELVIDGITSKYGHLIERFEANLVCRRFLQLEEEQGFMWVPCNGGSRRIHHSDIDAVAAEGDYVRIHCGQARYLVHTTMRKMSDQLDPVRFVRLNRSTIVRRDLITQTIHDARRWRVMLADGTQHPIAKSRCSAVLKALKVESSKNGADSASYITSGEKLSYLAEKAMH